MDIEIKVGDKVIRADGLAGNVTEVKYIERVGIKTPMLDYLLGEVKVKTETWKEIYATVKYENGTTGEISVADKSGNYMRFYLIGKTILGNKLAVSELDKQIADTHAQIEELKAKEAQLRKQRWRLETQMNPEITKQAVNIAPDEHTIKPSNSAVTGAKEAVTDGMEIKLTEDK